MHNNSRLIFEKYATGYFKSADTVLELGAHIPSHFQGFLNQRNIHVPNWKYADIISNRSEVYISKIDYIMKDENTVEAPSDSFDIIFSAQVLEHVRRPWVWIKELSRLLKVGGHLITISPVSWPYHEAPIDCWRAHPEGMRALYEDAGVSVEVCVSQCLETDKIIIPGKGRDYANLQPRFLSKVFSIFGWPLEASVDCITIGKKK